MIFVALGLIVGKSSAARSGEMGFRLAVDDFEREADLLVDAGDEVRPVDGDSAGLGRDEPNAGDAAVLHLGAADLERCQCAVDGALTESAGLGQALAEPNDPRKGVDDSKTFPRRAGDQQAAIIGAKIKRGVDVAVPS